MNRKQTNRPSTDPGSDVDQLQDGNLRKATLGPGFVDIHGWVLTDTRDGHLIRFTSTDGCSPTPATATSSDSSPGPPARRPPGVTSNPSATAGSNPP